MAELLGDVDSLLDRVEALPAVVAGAEQRIVATATVLEAATEKYRAAVMNFNEQARADLNDYLDLKASQVARAANRTIEEQRLALQEAARGAFYAKEFRRSNMDRFVEHLITALIASTLAASLVALLFQRH